MRHYSLHIPAIEPGQVLTDRDRLNQQMTNIVPIKEGFCWTAFFFSIFWSLWHRLWIVSFGISTAHLAAAMIFSQMSGNEAVHILISIGISVLLGFMGNDLRRTNLERRGFSERDVVLAGTAETAVRRYLMARAGGC